MEKVRYEEMLPHEIVARRKRFPAAFMALGGLEWHSEHLAVGNDALKAEKLCELAAGRSGGFAFPTLWYGEPRVEGLMEVNHDEDGRIKGKMEFKPEKFTRDYFGTSGQQQIAFYQQLLHHVLVQLNTLEMRAVCLVCGHYPIAGWAAPAVEKFNASFADTQAFAATEGGYGPASPEVGVDHAAKWETSHLWYLRPDCVDMSVYRGRERQPLIGIMGEDPRTEASIEIGRRSCELIVGAVIEKARTLVKKASGTPSK